MDLYYKTRHTIDEVFLWEGLIDISSCTSNWSYFVPQAPVNTYASYPTYFIAWVPGEVVETHFEYGVITDGTFCQMPDMKGPIGFE